MRRTAPRRARPALWPRPSPRRGSRERGHLAGFEELAVVLEAALDDDDPLGELAVAYRRYARQHPHLHSPMTEHHLQREQLAPDADLDAAWEHGLDAFRAGLR